uniref:UBC core domain-containing protein n=1 Tax=Percolomonas cosmopolitus TaxID=63605 RepID=A0A7S1KNP0_9EUKA
MTPSPTKECIRRLQREYQQIQKNPPPNISARPLENNITTWYYVIHSLTDTPYSGYYFGKIQFPYNYPYKPPSILMLTPNGRFHVNQRLCLSMSDFHPESWNPMWSVSSILTGLLSFMQEDKSTHGSIECSDPKRRQLAQESLQWNINQALFRELFPELTERIKEELTHSVFREKRKQKEQRERQLNEPLDWSRFFMYFGVFVMAGMVIFYIAW